MDFKYFTPGLKLFSVNLLLSAVLCPFPELSSMPAMMAVPEAEGEVSEGEVTSSKNEVSHATHTLSLSIVALSPG